MKKQLQKYIIYKALSKNYLYLGKVVNEDSNMGYEDYIIHCINAEAPLIINQLMNICIIRCN